MQSQVNMGQLMLTWKSPIVDTLCPQRASDSTEPELGG